MNKVRADDLIWKISECECELEQMLKKKENYNTELIALDEGLKKLDEYRAELSSINAEKIRIDAE